METSPCHNSVARHQIATNFCTCHDSTAVVPCTKFCSDHCIRIEVSVKRNFHRIWIAMEKPLVKRAPEQLFTRLPTACLWGWHMGRPVIWEFCELIVWSISYLSPFYAVHYPVSNFKVKTIFPGIGISIVKITWSWDFLILGWESIYW